MQRVVGMIIGMVVLGATLSGAQAAVPIDDISVAASASARAQPVFLGSEAVSIYNRANALQPDVEARAISAALAARADWAVGRGASVGMSRVQHGSTTVQAAPDGYRFPMSTTVLPLAAIGPLLGRDIAGVLASGFIVMGRTTADLRGAQAGDAVDLVAADGGVQTFTIGLVAEDDAVGGTELLMEPSQGDRLGITVDTRILIWGFPSRDIMDQHLAAVGLTGRPDVRVRRSWDAPDPDSTLGLADTKHLLGEFSYRVRPNGSDIDLDGAWVATYMPADREILLADIPIRARCHNTIKADLIAALAEVSAAGLAGAIDVANANAYGGCFYPRFARIAGELGYVSRHSFGQALDTNTTTNAQGTVPQMNCDVVRIFRKHNFAWGGNFLTPDGMHFEWVGERRDLRQYPSRYCPNLPAAQGTETAPGARPDSNAGANPDAGWATLFGDDAWAGE